MTAIAIISASNYVPHSAVVEALPNLEMQINRDFSPRWRVEPCTLAVYSPATINNIPPASWHMLIVDDTDTADALGYHTDTRSGQPVGYVFAHTTLENGLNWTITLSHELLEMVGDPSCTQSIRYGRNWYAYEACDPCESDEYGYSIGGTMVSDFVLPSWFSARVGHHVPYDFMSHIEKPRTLLPGGYMSVRRPHQDWTQVTARSTPDVITRPGTSGRSQRRATQNNTVQ